VDRHTDECATASRALQQAAEAAEDGRQESCENLELARLGHERARGRCPKCFVTSPTF
jgi:hypothetical protein